MADTNSMDESTTAPTIGIVTNVSSSEPIALSSKSYRRKYRKMMVGFERVHLQNIALFKVHERLERIQQRLARQTDQLLELVLEVNERPQIPASMRYNMDDDDDDDDPYMVTHGEPSDSELRGKRLEYVHGDLSEVDWRDIEAEIALDWADQHFIRYADLYKGLNLSNNVNDDMGHDDISGFVTATDEARYLRKIDDVIDGRAQAPTRLDEPGDRVHLERQAQLHNPMSIYNYLRKNKPRVFTHDVDHGKSDPARQSRRPPSAKVKEEENEGLDEERGPEHAASKNKRKRDDDGGYRPKGGHSRPMKRRKDDSERKSKRSTEL